MAAKYISLEDYYSLEENQEKCAKMVMHDCGITFDGAMLYSEKKRKELVDEIEKAVKVHQTDYFLYHLNFMFVDGVWGAFRKYIDELEWYFLPYASGSVGSWILRCLMNQYILTEEYSKVKKLLKI